MTTLITRLSDAPDLILYNARIYTVDPTMPWAEAIAIRKHRIIAIGSNADVLALAGPATQRMDLGGRLVCRGCAMPTSTFSATRFICASWRSTRPPARPRRCNAFAEHAAALPPGAWIYGRPLE